MSNKNLHAVLNPLGMISDFLPYKIKLVTLNTNKFESFYPRAGFLKRFIRHIDQVVSHICFSIQLMNKMDSRLLIVREFLTIPLLFSWPLLFLLKNKMLFVVNHNIQKCYTSKVHKYSLKLLVKFGCRLLMLESDAGFDLISKKKNHTHLVLPIPIIYSDDKCKINHADKKKSSDLIVGVVGNIRKEKGTFDLIRILHNQISEKKANIKILLGCPDQNILDQFTMPEFITINTTEFVDFERAISTCDAIILNYNKYDYFYRSSGVVVDAIKLGVMTIVPNFPVLRHQIEFPEKVGFTYEDIESIINELINHQNNITVDAFSKQKDYRSLMNISKILDDYIKINGL